MPTTLISGPYRFSFFSIDCAEPKHTHVWRDKTSAKFWLEPVKLEDNHGFSRKELRDVEQIILANLSLLKEKWDEHCAGATR